MNGSGIVFRPPQARFLTIPRTPLCYWLRERFFELLAEFPLGQIAMLAEPTTTGNNERFVRASWEIPNNLRWRWVSRGGGYKKWAGYQNWKID